MNKIILNHTKEEIYTETLDNGLKVFLIPFSNKNSYYINYYVNYGAEDLEFVPVEKSEMTTSPSGIAHFIEHQVFETGDEPSPFEFFGKSGASCNAATDYESTKYEVEGTKNLKENLDYLIRYVNTPCFTEESVEKEKGIIVEEIRMYDDYPEWILINAMNKLTFNTYPMKYDIAGTKTSVSNTKLDDLYKCFNTFYVPNNMALVVGGCFDPKEIMDLIKNNEVLKKRKRNDFIKRKEYVELERVVKEKEEIEASQLMIPRIGYIVKSRANYTNSKDKFKMEASLFILLQKAFGNISDFYETMLKEEKLLNISFYNFVVDNYNIINIICETERPKELVKEIDKRLKEVEVNKEDLERYKKVFIASKIRLSDNVVGTVSDIVNDLVDYSTIIDDKIDIVKSITLKDIKDIKKSLNLKNKAVVTVLPKNT